MKATYTILFFCFFFLVLPSVMSVPDWLLYKLEGHLEAFLVSVSSLSLAQSKAYTKVADLGMADFATFHREEPQERHKNCQITKIF